MYTIMEGGLDLEQTIQIEIGKKLRFENVVSLRKRMKHSEIEAELGCFIELIKVSGANKNGPLISASFDIEIVDGEQVIDLEFIIPIDRIISLPQGYLIKSFEICNAIYTRVEGSLMHIGDIYNQLMKYLQNNNLEQTTVAYNVNVNDEESFGYEYQPKVDIYIEVKLH